MVGHVIHLHGDQHFEAHSLLPWYVIGRLDAAESAQVEVHLNGCPECQAELKIEQALHAGIAGLRMEVEQDWATLRTRLERDPRGRPRPGGWRAWLGAISGGWTGAKRWAGGWWLTWALVPQLGLLLLLVGVLMTTARPAPYHVLGAGPVAVAGNVVVMFRPQTSEADLRRILDANQARVVDGPTSAGAWLVHVQAAQRSVALGRLRGQGEVELAEPVDSGESR
jgi:anti-sigma factor RsiW